MQALEDFKQGTVNVLVATDIAARGLDIELLPYVINYELPHVAEDYIHRIGRTGRAGSTGEAISLVCADEYRMLEEIERELKSKLERLPLPQLAGGRQSGSAPEHTTPRRAMRQATSRRPAVTSPPIPNRIPSRRRRRYPEVSISASHTRPRRWTTPPPPLQAIPATPALTPGQDGGRPPHCWADSPPKNRSGQ